MTAARRHARGVLAALALALGCAGAGGAEKAPPPPVVYDPLVPPATDAERLARSDAELARLRADASAVLAQVAEARAERDVVRLDCLDARAEAATALLRSGAQASESLAEAISRGDAGADAELARLGAARIRARQVRVEAEACMGRPMYEGEEKTAVRATKVGGQ